MGTAREHGVTRLYHFQGTLDYLEGNLRENWIHCSNPDNFNDPWDCKPYFDASSIDDPEQRPKWIAFFKEQLAASPAHEQAAMLANYGDEWYENRELLRRSIERTTK